MVSIGSDSIDWNTTVTYKVMRSLSLLYIQLMTVHYFHVIMDQHAVRHENHTQWHLWNESKRVVVWFSYVTHHLLRILRRWSLLFLQVESFQFFFELILILFHLGLSILMGFLILDIPNDEWVKLHSKRSSYDMLWIILFESHPHPLVFLEEAIDWWE